MIPVSPAPPERELLEEIFASPELARAGETRGALDQLYQRLMALLGDLLGSQEAGAAASAGRIFFFVAAVLALGWLLYLVLRRLRPSAAAEKDAPLAPERLEAPEAHLSQAAAARARGDLRLGMRHELLATLSRLEDRRLVGYGRHKTNREYVRDLSLRGAPAAVAEAFESFVREYDLRFYGHPRLCDADLEVIRAGRTRLWSVTADARPGSAAR